MNTQDVVKLMCDRIVEKFHPLQIILFGSRARGDNRPDSDVDLVVVLPKIERYRDMLVAIDNVVDDIEIERDILIATPEQLENERYNTAGVIYDALTEGKVVYERPS